MKHISTGVLLLAGLVGLPSVTALGAASGHNNALLHRAGAATDRLAEANRAKEIADKAFDEITRKLLASVDHNATYAAASADADSAQAAYDQLNETVVASLRNDAAYKAELTARDEAKKNLDYAHLTGQSSDEEKTALAKEVMTHNTVIRKMEADAAKHVPGLAAARSKAMAAQAKLAQIKSAYMKQVSQDPKWISARAAMDESHKRVSEAEAEVAKLPDHTRGPIAANPKYIQPRNIQPVNIQPVNVQPVVVQPNVVQPVTANPVAANPVNMQPVSKDPVVAQPVVAQPVNAQPVAKDPENIQPKAANPIPANPIPGGPPNN